MKIKTIVKTLKTDFKTLCRKINKYGCLNYHIRNGEYMAFSGKKAEYRKASFLLMLAYSEIKLPTKIIDYLISANTHNQTYNYLSCDNHIKVALASRVDLKCKHIEILLKSYYSNGAYVLRKLAQNPIIPEKILRDNLLKWFDYDGSGAYHGAAASLAIRRINFSSDEINKIYSDYKKENNNDISSIQILLMQSDCTPIDLFGEFCKSDDFHVKVALANNVKTPAKVLREFSKNNDSWIKNGAIKTLANI